MTKGWMQAEELRAWARENLDEGDPKLLEKLYDEARRRWGNHLGGRTISNRSKQAFMMIRYG